jgi:hypothetical protein
MRLRLEPVGPANAPDLWLVHNDDDWGQIYALLPAEPWARVAVMERIGMRYAGEIRSRGMVEGLEGEQDDAPFAVCVLLRADGRQHEAE